METIDGPAPISAPPSGLDSQAPTTTDRATFTAQLERGGLEICSGSGPLSLPCSACVHQGVVARWRADHPDFIPLSYPSEPVGYRIGEAGSGKDMGLFALRDFAAGDLISIETPLIMYPLKLPGIEEFDKDTMFNELFAALNPDQQAVLLSMANCKGDMMPMVEGILKTNVLAVTLPGGETGYAGLFPVMGRANHSCCPSVVLRFDQSSFALEIRAVRAIKAGEEIVSCYVQDYGPRDLRRVRLKASHNFICRCAEACSLPDKESAFSDARRRRIGSWVKQHKSYETWVIDLGLPDDLIVRETKQVLRIIALEKLEIDSFPYLSTLSSAFAALEDAENYKIWAARAQEIAEAHLGDHDPVVLELGRGIENPTRAPEWGKRREYREKADDNFNRLIQGGFGENQTWEEIMAALVASDNVA